MDSDEDDDSFTVNYGAAYKNYRDFIYTSPIKVNILNGYGPNDRKFTRNMMHYNFSIFFYDI